jgi:predicted transcriptional regulator
MTWPLDTVHVVACIVTAYVSSNRMMAQDLPSFIETVHRAVIALGQGGEILQEVLKPAVPVRRSVTDDYVVCLEDGQRFKSLKRHLRSGYNLTPEQYRVKWGLPHDYPMVAPSYAAKRSTLAKQIGLGRRRGRRR